MSSLRRELALGKPRAIPWSRSAVYIIVGAVSSGVSSEAESARVRAPTSPGALFGTLHFRPAHFVSLRNQLARAKQLPAEGKHHEVVRRWCLIVAYVCHQHVPIGAAVEG